MPRITVRTTKIHDGDSKHELVRRLTSATSPGSFPLIHGIAGSNRLRPSSDGTAPKSGSWLRGGRARTNLRLMLCLTT